MITAEKAKPCDAPWEGEDFWEGDPWAPIPENLPSFDFNQPGQLKKACQYRDNGTKYFQRVIKNFPKISAFSDGWEGVRKK
jgi:hypothetical protein